MSEAITRAVMLTLREYNDLHKRWIVPSDQARRLDQRVCNFVQESSL